MMYSYRYMGRVRLLCWALFICLAAATPLRAAGGDGQGTDGTIFTIWPLVDYRESPQDGYSNLSLLGPLFKYQVRGEERSLAVRPLFYRTELRREQTSRTDYLYPIVTVAASPDETTVQGLKLFETNSYRQENDGGRRGTMLFPLYISGTSARYGPYRSLFPIYGDIYERFWRDEYHFVLFPLYGRTVNKGTTTRYYLFPFFSTVAGEGEQGFRFWPLYGSSAKEGVYREQFVLWPFYVKEQVGLDTPDPTTKTFIFPFYAATDSRRVEARTFLWPFFGYSDNRENGELERDYLWPLWLTVRGGGRHVDRFLPFYAEERDGESLKRWYLWPFYRHDELTGKGFSQEQDRLLFFLYWDRRQSWVKDGSQRRRVACWPLFLFNRDANGVRSLSFPAPVEPILDREGIERNWAPLWRIYQHRWNDNGDSAASLLWNLYWHERRGPDLAFELFPLVSYRSEKGERDVKILKGLLSYRLRGGKGAVGLLWLPPFIGWWGEPDAGNAGVSRGES